MRRTFCKGLTQQAQRNDFVFLTGDLGYAALEPLREAMGSRFLNAGVAEQNLVGVSAGLAKAGLRPWIYSIAPFLYARPFEQIRNDLCLHRLPVVVVGNGGGYGYGVMGATHHAIEDYGVLLTLSGLTVQIPAFDRDLESLLPQLFEATGPVYLRLGLGEQPDNVQPPDYQPWRKLMAGSAGTLIAVGPLAGGYWRDLVALDPSQRPSLWCLSTLPIGALPEELVGELRQTRKLVIAEEHVAQGSAGHSIMVQLLRSGLGGVPVDHVTAVGYPSGTYGSQRFHRKECGLDPASIRARFNEGGQQ
ncbi:MAG: transketolase [Planctomycetia bacterium]